MWLRITEIKIHAKYLSEGDNAQELALLKNKIYKRLGMSLEQGNNSVSSVKIYRKSPDLRKKSEPQFVYTVDVEVDKSHISKQINNNEITVISRSDNLYEDYIKTVSKKIIKAEKRPVVVGFGPAGMFSALV